MALRMARQDEVLSSQVEVSDADLVAGLPSVQAIAETTDSPMEPEKSTVGGDDDTDDELAEDYDSDGMEWA